MTLGISPTQMGSRITSWGVMVEVNIPLQQTTRRAQEAEAEAMVGAARSRSQAVANQLVGDLGENLAAWTPRAAPRRWWPTSRCRNPN